MRDIQFRAKDKITGDWHLGYYVHDVEWAKHYIFKQKLVGAFWKAYPFEVIPETVGQFTGLKDKDGVEVYEGDILKCTEVDEDSAAGREFEIIGEVAFGSGGKSNYVPQYPGSFCLISKEVYHEQALLSSWRARYEVIGNIHDNPELLK